MKIGFYKMAGVLCVACGVAFSASKVYRGAEVFSKEQVHYGKFEFRMRTAYGSGILSTFFTYYNDSWKGGDEPWREIDLEVMGKKKNLFQSNIITGNANRRITSEMEHEFEVNLCDDYHTYSVEWTPDYVAWFFDGKEVRRNNSQAVRDLQDKSQSYRFNLWAANIPAWAGTFDPSILPVYQYISWFRYYEYTPGKGPDGSNFTFKWQDDFNTFDEQRWDRADWTFEENLADFYPGNAVVKEGTLILCLTNSSSTGHTGAVPHDEQTGINNNIKKSDWRIEETGVFDMLHGKFSFLNFVNTKSRFVNIEFFNIRGELISNMNMGYREPGKYAFDISPVVNKTAAMPLVVRISDAPELKPYLITLP